MSRRMIAFAEKLKQFGFNRNEFDHFRAAVQFAGGHVEAIKANFMDGFFGLLLLGSTAFQCIAYPEIKLLHTEQLGDIVVRAEGKATNAFFLLHRSGEEKNGNIRVQLTNVLSQRKPILKWRTHIQDTDIEAAGLECRQSFIATVAKGYRKAFGLQVFLGERA